MLGRTGTIGVLMLLGVAPLRGDPRDASLQQNAVELESRISEALDRLPEDVHHELAGRAGSLAKDLSEMRRHARQFRYLVQPRGSGTGGMPGTFVPSSRTGTVTLGPNGIPINTYHPRDAVDLSRGRRFSGGEQPFDESASREFRRLVAQGKKVDQALDDLDAPGLEARWDDEISPLLRVIRDQLIGL